MSDYTFRPMTVTEVSEYLGISRQMIYKLIRANNIGGVIRFGTVIRFDRAKLDQWIQSQFKVGD